MQKQVDMQELQTLLKESSSEQPPLIPNLSEEALSALYNMAYQLYRSGKYEDARQFFRFLTLANTFERRFWIGLGASYQMLKNFEAAIECYSVAAVQEPTDPYIHWYAAECFFSLEKYKDALKALDSAIINAKEKNIQNFVSQLELVQKVWLDKEIEYA